ETQIGITEEISVQKQKMFMLSGSLKEAIAETEKLSAAFPNESRYYSMLAELHLSNKDYNKALNYYNKVTEIDPTNPYVRISLAEYYRTIGNKHQSFVELKKGFANPTLDIDTKIQVMMSYYSVTEIYDELKGQAFELAEVLVETHPDDPKSHSMLADFLVREERYEEARDSFRKVISLDASRYIIWETLLRLDIMLNDIGSLEIDSQKTIELFPLQPMPYMFAGLGAYQSNHYTDALKMFNAGKDMVVDDIELAAEFYMYLGDVYNQLKDHKLSDQSYEKSLQLKPDNPSVLNNFSYFLALRKARLDEAEQMAKRANELAPDNKHYLDTYAWVLYQKGNYPEALRWLERALQHTGTDNAVVLEHYGDVLFKLYRINEAQEYWRRAAKTGKGSEFLEKKIKEGILYE
ncbi:MAG: tetratricopeptide repeat protein, partial [Bacteroidales bacterium]|nr:tetratricopeptide repeat protein [Bacteroidales bacterium]